MAEVATLLRLNQQTVRNMIDRGELGHVRVGQRRVRIRQSQLDAFLAAGESSPQPPEAAGLPAMPEDITPQLATVGASLMDELIGRLDTDLPEKDLTAIATAISKAVMRAAKVLAASVPNIEVLDPDPEEVDLWAERYGGDDDPEIE